MNYYGFLALVILVNLGLLLFLQPRWLLGAIALIIPGVVYFAPTEQPLIALTIDDAPDNKTTALILDVLNQYEVKATFFVISSRITGNEAIMGQMVEQGHEIANHLTEDKPSIFLSPEAFKEDLQQAHLSISRFGEVRWLRPASGFYTPKMVETAQKQGYRVALGSVFPYDTFITSSQFARFQILSNVRPGSIIVLHDSGVWGLNTVATLREILPKLKEKGYQFVTLSELYF
jgi:peptidoglycan/xylan/chitin deacetylase (PgdA/CDA1 family)